MSVIILAETNKGRFKKAAFEAVHYGHLAAKSLGGQCIAVVFGEVAQAESIGKYGAVKLIKVNGGESFDSGNYSKALVEIAQKENAHTVVVNHSSTGKAIAGRIAVKWGASVVSQVNSVPEKNASGVQVNKPVFSGKAIAHYTLMGDKRVLSLMGNAIQPVDLGGTCELTEMTIDYAPSKIKVKELKTVEGVVPLPEAELVVSAGRGMKGPENWGIIEELAKTIGATTACSRPVADSGWRPHHEHVGQTGVAIRPNLYIAIGISGAIQHLAGVNSSKCIVVINKDAEAPFFKAADYGVCADLFDVVPKLTEAFKKLKNQ